MFRNAHLFRFPATVGHAFEPRELEQGASFEMQVPDAIAGMWGAQLKPVGALELASQGFIEPHGAGSGFIAMRQGDCVWLAIGSEEKILPPAVVNKALAEKLTEIEKREGRRPGGRTRKRIKEDVLHELLPRALVRPGRVDCYLDLARGVLVVDTASRKRAESVVSEIRHALGSFPALPLNAEVAPRAVMTGWVAGEPLPEGLAISDCATLKDAADSGASVKLKHQELAGQEVAQHRAAGKQVSRIRLAYEGGLDFTLDEDLALRQLSYGDAVFESLEGIENTDMQAELDARFALMSGVLGNLFDVLEGALRLSKAEG